MDEETFFSTARFRMVEEQIASRGIHDSRLLEALRTVPRHRFVRSEDRGLAYTDGPLPIGLGQTISQPYIVALMTDLLQLKGSEIVLEIGTGSGYQSAVLSRLVDCVHTIERHSELARRAESLLADLQISNVKVHIGDGSQGLRMGTSVPDLAPFAGILVTAAAPHIPQALLNQLKDGGRLVIPVGQRYGQLLECWQRQGETFKKEVISPVAFVPLIGVEGFKE